MSFEARGTLFIFFDESGNFDFGPRGTRFWALGGLCTYHPAEGREAFLRLAYELAEEGRGQECFHATEDKQIVRDQMFDLIARIPKSFDVHFAIAQKNKVPPGLRRSDVSFYGYMCKRMLRFLLGLEQYQSAKKLVIVFSTIFNKNKHEQLLGELKAELKDVSPLPFSIYFRANNQDLNCLIADYCCWAISIKWTRHDLRSYELIRKQIRSEENLFPEEGTTYYEYEQQAEGSKTLRLRPSRLSETEEPVGSSQ